MISSSNKIIETPTKKRLRHRCFHVNVVHNTSGRPVLCNLTHSFPMHPFSTRVLIIPERLRLTLFSQSALISQLHQHSLRNWNLTLWGTEILVKNVLLLWFLVKNCFGTLSHIFCTYATGCSFQAIIFLCVNLCQMTLFLVENRQLKFRLTA